MFAIELTAWERQQLGSQASANALTYMGHHSRSALRPNEIEEMERWKALADKINSAAEH